MKYVKRMETRIIRTTHRVSLSIGGSSANLKQALQPIPLDARLIDIAEDENNCTVLIFETEAVQE